MKEEEEEESVRLSYLSVLSVCCRPSLYTLACLRSLLLFLLLLPSREPHLQRRSFNSQFAIRNSLLRRTDLQMAGRTVIGKPAPRGQEMCDHYMAAFTDHSPALACIQEIQEESWLVGIPIVTRHLEVAPNQFELAPMFGRATMQVDQNVLLMEIIESTAAKYDLAALLQEKPFDGVNGSGKHNNWSIWTAEGTNLLHPNHNKTSFPVVMAAMVSAVQEYGDLLRMAISTPGNDFRLGACEAPPAIISTYLGEDVTNFLEKYKNGQAAEYKEGVKTLDLGTSSVMPFEVPAQDRNRTSPFPYGGGRFEFRAVGSSQNVSMVNAVLNTITAQKFKEFSDAIEGGDSPSSVAAKALEKSWHVIFNGDNYDEANQEMLTKRGVWRIDSGVDAIQTITHDKNKKLFSGMGVLTAEECDARGEVMHDHYTGSVELEALSLIDMINQNVIPSLKEADLEKKKGKKMLSDLEGSVKTLKEAMAGVHAAGTAYEKAKLARVLRLETMVKVREICDAVEEVVPEDCWTLATYKELLFLDQTTR